ncbi:MAG: hypothetical protein ABIJ17_03475 [Patescibacteria group bacterium]
MQYIADFHIHSKYSRATSKDMDVENLDKWANIKGVDILGTGDFTHPLWFKELKEKLEPAEQGLFKIKKRFKIKNGIDKDLRFILTAEISSIYSKGGKVRKIHNLIFAPSFDVVDKINAHLGWIGNIKSDGRPILGLDAKELAKIVFKISKDCMIIPAHCLLPDSYLHVNNKLKKIKNVSENDKVFTHKGRWRKVEEVYKRKYNGKIYNIRPYYFRLGLKTTSEHPFYAIKTYKDCLNVSHNVCKPICAYKDNRKCTHEEYKKYKPEWIQAKNIEKGDILIFPRFLDKIKDIKEIKLSDFLNKKEFKITNNKISCFGGRAKLIPNKIEITKDFCRLIGYYMSEGYTDSRDSISFCFHENEEEYVEDLKKIMKKSFNLEPREYSRDGVKSIEIIYFSKILSKIFKNNFYNDSNKKTAITKELPSWILDLPLEKQKEILIGWWRGDVGATSSRSLMNQMKIILLRLGIIPSILEQDMDKINSKKSKIGNRIITANYNSFCLTNLSFLKDDFNLLKTPEFKKFNTKLKRRHGWMDNKYIYIPVRDIEVGSYKGDVYNLEVKQDNSYTAEFAIIHNCYTPWFSIFGSKSGFDSIEECFEEYSKDIFAIETGLSSDPIASWANSSLDNITLISNGDAHSPRKIGREANIFEGKKISYNLIKQAIKRESKELKLIETLEFFPEEGKYHWDGHRKCNIVLSPEESDKHNNICPVCKKPLTIGVMNRVFALADRKLGEKHKNTIPFRHIIPLDEIIGNALDVGPNTKTVETHYKALIKAFKTEFNILLNVSKEKIASVSLPEIADGIDRVRKGKVSIQPGYDGEFGKINVFKENEKRIKNGGQDTLF